MKVYIDISVLTLATFVTGIQRVTREVILYLLSTEDADLVLIHYDAKKEKYRIVDAKLFEAYYRNHSIQKHRMITKKTIEIHDIKQGDVFFDLDAAWMGRVKRSYLLPILKQQGVKIIAHIYDIISITHPQYCLQRGVYYFMDYLGAHLQYADEIIVNANATVMELEKLAQSCSLRLPKVSVVPLGADFRKQKKGLSEHEINQEMKLALSNPYILMVGTIEPRKNHKLLLDTYDKYLCKMGINIVFAGNSGWNMDHFMERLKSHQDYGKHVFYFEGLPDYGIHSLYENAYFLAFCSYTEGFGLPLIEAIQRGTPVIAANIPINREVMSDYGLYFEQDNPESITSLIEWYLKHPDDYSRHKSNLQSFSATTWNECGNQIKQRIFINE